MGIGESSEQAPFWYEHLLMPTFLRGSTKDKTAMESTVQQSGLDFVIVRPPILSEEPATGSVHLLTAPTKGHKITRADLAQFLLINLAATNILDKPWSSQIPEARGFECYRACIGTNGSEAISRRV